ncbi:DUF6703 family protein [Ornithinimicrobium murale]|uniref:DUF6703 family protein n=1 Tax=Ornithinimicrobium murale TaxID=1050153 RepID=UPI000E0DD181|nr:DUF6703 family protein [Ornithinimicrobium murale]
MSNPITSPDPHYQATGARAAIERASVPVLKRLALLPTWLPMVVIAALILAGAFLGGPLVEDDGVRVAGVLGLGLIGVALLALFWLLYLSWPHLTPPLRMMRIAVLVLLLVIVVTQFVTP